MNNNYSPEQALKNSTEPPSGSGNKSSPPVLFPQMSLSNTNKAAFMTACEQLFDSQEVTNRLQAQLNDQLKKSTDLILLLSNSGKIVEGLVRSQFRDMQKQYFGTALSDINRRLVLVEQNLLGSSRSEEFSSDGKIKSSTLRETDGAFTSIADRLDAIERSSHLRRNEQHD